MKAVQNKNRRSYLRKLEKRLHNTVYSHQLNDFYFLTIPEGHKHAGEEVPVDYKLKKLVLYFWKHKFITCGWNQGFDDPKETPYYNDDIDDYTETNKAFISFKKVLINGNDAYDYLKKKLEDKFGIDNIIDYDNQNKKREIKHYIKNKPNKLILKNAGAIFLIFNKSFIDDMHDVLGLDTIDHASRHPGYITRTKAGYKGSIQW